jgi:hypothetical protein
MRLARETWLLLAVGLADLFSTVYLVRAGVIREANPIMAWYLVHFGTWVFCVVKCVMLMCPLFILEWVRRVKPYIGHWALRTALVAYLALYVVGVWSANDAHITRGISPYLSKVSHLWRQRTRQTTPDWQTRPPAMPVEKEGSYF